MSGRYIFGLDLGQASDPTALAVARAEWDPARPPPERWAYAFGDLHRWPLGTPYTAIVADLAARLAQYAAMAPRPELTLVIDGTGVGRAVNDMFRAARLPARLVDVTIHGGDQVAWDQRGSYRVPKRDLVGCVQVLSQTRRLRVAAQLPEAATLRRELQAFKVTINPETAHDSYAAWREGDHDDLVLAVALACWYAERAPKPRSGRLVTLAGS